MTIYAYRKRDTGQYPVFQGDIRLEYPDMGETFVCPDTYEPVYASTPPLLTASERLSEAQPVMLSGRWVQQFEVVAIPTPEPEPSKVEFPKRPKPTRPTGRPAIFPTEATGRIEVTRLGQIT